MTGYNSKRSAAQDKLTDDDDTQVYAEQRQQQAEPPPEWPLIKNILAVFGLDAISFVAKWQAAQRPWVGLTPEEILDMFDINNVYGSKWIEFARTVEAKLKAKNDH